MFAIQNGAGDSTNTTGPGPAYSTSPECFTVTRHISLIETAIEEVLPHALRSRREHPFRWMSDEAVRQTW